MTALLKIKNLACLRSNNTIFSNLSFGIEKGKNVEIVGSNGSGKTTLLKCILGLIEIEEGTIFWKNKQLKDCRNSFLRSCFYQGHQLSIKPSFTVFENLKYSGSAIGLDKEKISEACKKVGLKDYLFRTSSDLSIGQLKRVAIARWILKDLDIYLIDEPFTSLDENGSVLINEIVKDLNSKGISFLITGHRPSSVTSEKIYLDDY